MSKLSPCPFCGNEHPLIKQNSYGVEISCPNCQTIFRCDCTAGHNMFVEDTIKHWNRRIETKETELYSEPNKEATQQTITKLHSKWDKETLRA